MRQRILADRASGAFLERGGGATYRPGADLTGTVMARDAIRTFPAARNPHRDAS